MRVLIIDDDPFVCTSLTTILNAQDDMDVTGLGHDGNEAVALYAAQQPDILLMDIQMAAKHGLDAAREILGSWPEARIVFLTTFADDDYIVSALHLGAKGYLIKQDVAKIAPALRSVMAGQSVLGGEVLERLDSLMRLDSDSFSPTSAAGAAAAGTSATGTANGRESTAQAAGSFTLDELSERENEVITLIARGLDNKQIAATLFIGEGTVRNHISVILTKTKLKNRTQLAIRYYQSQG